jgi:phosphate transport system substrate-binding protein
LGCFFIASPVRLNAAGATFPDTIYMRWFSDITKSGGPKVNYQSIGSGGGRKAFMDETVSFAASDDPIKEKDIQKVSRGVVQIPTGWWNYCYCIQQTWM